MAVKQLHDGRDDGAQLAAAATDKVGFWGKAPVDQPAKVTDATDAATAITQINAVIDRLEECGILATS